MQKHTPGPWHLGMKPGPILYGPNGEQVADMTANLLPNGEAIANARLIAAAPELLAALQGLLKADAERNDFPGFASAGNWLRADEAARAVIAKINA